MHKISHGGFVLLLTVFTTRTLAGAPTTQVAKLLAADAAAANTFGISVAISGDTLVVGANGDDDAGSDSGAAYVFERNAGGADNWGQVRKLTASGAAAQDDFGWAVSISGDTIVVGAPEDAAPLPGSGMVYVFERNAGGADSWDEVAKLTASDAAGPDGFGSGVSIAGDIAVVGAPGNDDAGPSSGSAYVFERNAGGADNWNEVAKLLATGGAAEDHFGVSVAIDGDTAIVGTLTDPDDGNGANAAYVFQRNAGGADSWDQVAELTSSDAAPRDLFGWSVSISGDTATVGASLNDDAGSGSGSAYVFGSVAGRWAQIAKPVASDADSGDQFGQAAASSG